MSLVCLLRTRLGANALKAITLKQHLWQCRSLTAPLTQLCATTQFLHQPHMHCSSSHNTNTQWTTIYRLPLIRLAAAFNRLKIYQGLLTVVAVPAAISLEQSGQLAANASIVVSAIGISGLLTLALASLFVRNTVGFVYVNEPGDKVKLAYVDYWGRRQQTIVSVDDIVPIANWQQKMTSGNLDFYQTVRVEGASKQTFKLLSRYAVIEEPETFAGIFGE